MMTPRWHDAGGVFFLGGDSAHKAFSGLNVLKGFSVLKANKGDRNKRDSGKTKSVARDGSQRFLFTIIRIWLLDHPHVLLIELLAVALAYDATHGIAAVNAVDSDALQRVVEHAVLAHHA